MKKKIIKQLFEEHEGFKEYAHMIDECKDPAMKAELKKIAEEEVKHYKRLHELVFGGVPVEHMTFLEQSLYDYTTEAYLDMVQITNSWK